MADRRLLEDGSFRLLEDGTSFRLVEGEHFTINAIRCRQAVNRAATYGLMFCLRVLASWFT